MAYQKGDAKLVVCDCGLVPCECSSYDSRGDSNVPRPYVRLPHSCDSWIVGGKTEVQLMIEDLKAVLEQL